MDAERLSGFGAELAQDVGRLLIDQLTSPLSMSSQLYWMHIAAALALAALVVVRERRYEPGRARFIGLQLRSIGRALSCPSARVDYAYYFVNGVVYPMLVLPWLASDEALRGAVRGQLAAIVGPPTASASPGAFSLIALSAAIFLAFDFGRWVGHFLQHKVPALWEFHKVHHSAKALSPITNFRVHPVDLAVMATCSTGTVGATAGVILYFFPADASLFGELSLRAAALLFLFDLAGALLRHSSVWLSYGPRLGRVFISPAQHQIHHSTDPRHWGKNMGFALAVWDWIAGTLYVTREREELTYGSGDGDDDAYSSVLRLYGVPIHRLLRRLWAPRARPTKRAQPPDQAAC